MEEREKVRKRANQPSKQISAFIFFTPNLSCASVDYPNEVFLLCFSIALFVSNRKISPNRYGHENGFFGKKLKKLTAEDAFMCKRQYSLIHIKLLIYCLIQILIFNGKVYHTITKLKTPLCAKDNTIIKLYLVFYIVYILKTHVTN